jgi:F-type H+-transporting ATPase subunit a
MNENLFTSFITPTIIGLPIVTLVILFPSIILPAPNQLISNQYVI